MPSTPFRICIVALLLAALALPAAGKASLDLPDGSILHDFEEGLGPWRATPDSPAVKAVSVLRPGRLSRVIEFKLNRDVSACLRMRQPIDLSGFRAMRFEVRLPKTHANMHLAVHCVDTDNHWFQTAGRITAPKGEWVGIEVDLRPEAAAFESVGHARPWGPYVARGIRQIGLHLFADRPVSGSFCLDDIAFVRAPEGPVSQEIFNFETSGNAVGRYERFEITFELTRTYENPFDPSQIAVWGRFTAPSGRIVTVPGFFHQDFERRIEKRIERLIPVGSPKWKIRFAPREAGE